MKITNAHGVPETLVALAQRDDYTKGRADFSVTEIISPPRIQRLRRRHWEEMEQDVSSMLWPLLGSALHVVAEKGQHPDYTTEERLFAEVDGITLSGAIDVQKRTPDGLVIIDYKFTSAWAVQQASKPEWEAQLNIYAWLVRANRQDVVCGAQICALVRDWSRREAMNKPDYPRAPIVMIDIPLWPNAETDRYIKERVNAHRESKVAADWGDELPLCSPVERWERPTMYAVRRDGRKTAIRVFPGKKEAEEFANGEKNAYVEVRPGEPVRCTGDFCGVSQWCSQYKKYLEEKSS